MSTVINMKQGIPKSIDSKINQLISVNESLFYLCALHGLGGCVYPVCPSWFPAPPVQI